jgi:hypothetical protein
MKWQLWRYKADTFQDASEYDNLWIGAIVWILGEVLGLKTLQCWLYSADAQHGTLIYYPHLHQRRHCCHDFFILSRHNEQICSLFGSIHFYSFNEAEVIKYVEKNNLNNLTKVRNTLHCRVRKKNLRISWSTELQNRAPTNLVPDWWSQNNK